MLGKLTRRRKKHDAQAFVNRYTWNWLNRANRQVEMYAKTNLAADEVLAVSGVNAEAYREKLATLFTQAPNAESIRISQSEYDEFRKKLSPILSMSPPEFIDNTTDFSALTSEPGEFTPHSADVIALDDFR